MKKKLEDLPSNWKEIILSVASEGGLNIHFQNALGLSRRNYSELKEHYPEFDDAIEHGKRVSEEWWVNKAIRAFEGEKSKMFNQHLWAFVMKNRFNENWKEKTEMDITSKGKEVNTTPIQIEIIKSQDK